MFSVSTLPALLFSLPLRGGKHCPVGFCGWSLWVGNTAYIEAILHIMKMATWINNIKHKETFNMEETEAAVNLG